MKKILVYCPRIAGHRLEYIHHLYEGARLYKHNYVFAVPQIFEEQKYKLKWSSTDNVSFITIEDKFINQSYRSKIKQAYFNSKKLGYYSCKYR